MALLVSSEESAVNWLVVGRFGRSHGIKGFIKLISFTEPRDNIVNYKPLYAFIDKRWQQLNIERVEYSDKHLLVKIKQYDDPETAASLTNIEVAIDEKQLPSLPQGQYYWHDLIGLKVINKQGKLLGKVVEMLATGSNDVFIVQGEERHLIPYLWERFIVSISLPQQEIIVDWDDTP